ncbi:MAG: tetratricopeptide repeat protein [Acidobacteriota bacterium]|nr:tetratricopeptide repeat protein [Acidobacteriota bacterium]
MNTAAIKLSTFRSRVLLVLPAILLLMAAFFAVRWCLAQSVAEQADAAELAEFAINLAPDLSLPHYALGTVSEKTFSPEADAAALREYERATALSPHDFRLWLALGKMRERTGDSDGAEKAMRKAVELAPAYAQIRWTLGNILLRRSETDEAFNEIGFAARQNPATYAAPAVAAAMQTFGANNIDEILRRVGNSTEAHAALIGFLAKDGKFEQALSIWKGFSEEQRLAHKDEGRALFNSLLEAKRFRLAQTIYNELPATEDPEKTAVGTISNADFETDRISTPAAPLPFSWFIPDGAEPAIAFDTSTRRSGTRSLQFAFKTISGQDLRQVSQIVTVEPGARYRLSFYVRTAGLKTSATVLWNVEDAADGKILAASPAVPTGDNDWQQLTVDFATSPKIEAINIRLARAACVLSPCALVGRIWFDDFSLQKIDSAVKN